MKALIFVSILWAFSFGMIKGELTGIDPTLVSAIRLLLCALVFLPFLKINTSQKLSVNLLALGAVQFGVMYWAYIQSYQYLPGYLVAVFTIFTPIYVYTINGFITRQFRFSSLLPIIGSILGAAIIVYKSPNAEQWLIGFLILQIANVAFAFGQVGYQRLTTNSVLSQQASNHLNNMAIMYIGAAIFMMITVVAGQTYQGLLDISARQWLVLLYLGVIASGVGFAAWNYGAKQVSTNTLAIMNNGYIPFAVIFSLTLFNESADISRLVVGSAIMLGCLWLIEHQQVRANNDSN
ncbi:EamA family transporter [Colwellia sp. MEBiC06753]